MYTLLLEGFKVIKNLFFKMIIVKTIIHVEEAFENIQVKTYFNAFDFNFEFSLP